MSVYAEMTIRGHGSTLHRNQESSRLAADSSKKLRFGVATVNTDWRNEIKRLKVLADRIESGERQGKSAARSLRMSITRIESAVATALEREAELRCSRIKGPRQRTTPITYAVEPSRRGPALCEYRSSAARPFKVPKPVYDALVRIMSKAKEPTKFAQLDNAIADQLGEHVPEYLPRSVIRFWITCNLIEHSGARFAPKLHSTAFRLAAKEAWKRAADTPMNVVPNAI